MKAKIFDCSRTCGDGCCSWGEIYVTYGDERYEDFTLIEDAVAFCLERGWDYAYFTEVDEE